MKTKVMNMFHDDEKTSTPQKCTQEELNNLIKDLNLPKDGAELLASRLKEKNLLSEGTKVTIYRNRDEEFRKYFSRNEELVYCSDIVGLMNELKENVYKPEE